MIRDHYRLKAGAAQVGAPGPGLPGPFGVWPANDHQDDEDQERELTVDRAQETST
ncbi:hypothetical protein [Streptomyces sp. NRRL B-3648]|uniref:hypothetical protein n=1 Tax=Streptomyces sp. NRRL B-3648 TaxID=1519493 RepID=UPI000A9317BD|nr:hypothetical protein [Streptomyces sp. NRRL B-3648]